LTLALGVGVIAGAWGLRRHVLSVRNQQAVKPMRDPQQVAIEQQLATLLDAARSAPNDVGARWKLADFFHQYGLISKAVGQLQIIERLDPHDMKARVQMGNDLLFFQKYPEAEAAYRDVTRKDPKNLAAWQGLSAALIKEQRYLEGNMAARQALALNKDDTNTHLLLGTSALDYAEQFPNPGTHAVELSFARKELEDLTKKLPDSGQVYYHLGRACEEMHDKQGAIKNLQRAHELLPDDSAATRRLAEVYKSTGDALSALKLMRELVAKHPDSAEAQDLLGQLLQGSDAPDANQQALAAFQKAVQLRPNAAFPLEHLGTAYVRVSNFPEAKNAFERVIQLNPNRAYAYQQLAAIYTRLGDAKKASIAARVSQEMTFNDQQLIRIQALTAAHPYDVNLHLILADRYRELGQISPSRDEYLVALKLDKHNVRAQKGMALLAKATPPAKTSSPAKAAPPSTASSANASPLTAPK